MIAWVSLQTVATVQYQESDFVCGQADVDYSKKLSFGGLNRFEKTNTLFSCSGKKGNQLEQLQPTLLFHQRSSRGFLLVLRN